MEPIINFTNTILCGNNIEWMQKMPSDSIDVIATDPPYGYSFMGKDWDKAVPSIQTWEECYRLLKPGAFLYVLSAPRQDVLAQMITRIGAAGFDTSFSSIYWTYANGFPKAQNIGKAIDKKLGATREIISGTSKPIEYSGKFDQRSSSDRPKDSGAVSPEAKSLDGTYAGFQPKPAVEIVIVAMKPLSEKTYMAQAMNNGKGVSWLDNCRIPYTSDAEKEKCGFHGRTVDSDIYGEYGTAPAKPNTNTGRFPANVLVEDDVLNDGRIIPSSRRENVENKQYSANQAINMYGKTTSMNGFDDSGSFSRYFSLDAWWDKTIQDLPENIRETFPFIITPKASKSEKNKGCDEIVSNDHPTVKPIKLMSYLLTLGSQPDNITLDPFAGSGSTCIAAKITDRIYVGIDQSEDYCNIAKHRLDAWNAPTRK